MPQPLIVPAQSVPLSEAVSQEGLVVPGPLASVVWWLFFSNLSKRVADLSSRPSLSVNLAADYISTDAWVDIGLSVNLTQTGLYEIAANIDWSVDVDASRVEMRLAINDIPQDGVAGLFIGAASVRASSSYTWYYRNSGAHIAQLQNRKITPIGNGKVFAGNTGLRVKFLG